MPESSPARHAASSATESVVPIPGSKRRVTLEDSAGAASLTLSAADLTALEAAAPIGGTSGERYGNPAMMKMVRL